MRMVSRNPYTGQINGEFETIKLEDAAAQIEKTRQAFYSWKRKGIGERAGFLKNAAGILRQGKEEWAKKITLEMGKPIEQSRGEIEKCAAVCDFFADNAEKFLEAERIPTEAAKSYVRFDPLGVVLGIMPWNFPFWQVFRFAVPALMAGNACVLKHASNVPMTAVAIENVFSRAGFPEHVFKTLLADSQTAMQVIEKELVDAVSLTGSVEAGAQVASLAGRHIKKVVLELGGSDPFIVLEDADISKTAAMAIQGRMINSGQSCIASKRFIVMASREREFTDALQDELASLKVGDPMDPKTNIGPLAKREFVEGLTEQLEDAARKGGRVIEGPAPPEGPGFFFRPVVVADAKPEMRVVAEEVFGPIMPILSEQTEEDVIRTANRTIFGLGASIWTRDLNRAERMAGELDAGFVAINDTVKSDARLPFGGIKKSGLGRELSHYGLKEFTNLKTVVVRGA